MPLPSFSEQKSIADFLDKKCAEIDEMIALQEKIIEELKAYKQSVITEAVTKGLNPDVPMKDSGISWIGKIPEGWKMYRIKYLCIFNPTESNASNFTSVGYAPMNSVRWKNVNASTIERSKLSSGLTYFENGDIVMAKVTPCFENGNIAIAQNLHNGRAYGSSELFVFRPTNINTLFMFFALQNEYFKSACCSTMTGTGGLKRVSPTYICGCPVPLPPLSEQKSIAEYLDKKCADIDSLISTKNAKIEELKEYKKSIIYEYVTGKKEVES